MVSIILISLCCALALTHPPTHSQVETAKKIAMEIDRQQLTSEPSLKIAQGLENIFSPAGKPITLKCKVAYTPSASFMWTFNGKPVQGNVALNVEEKLMNVGKPIVESGMLSSTFVMGCPSSENSGVYKCIATNGHKTVESAAEIEIEGENRNCESNKAPSIVQWSDSRFEMETNVATLMCRADKPAEFTWIFNEKVINGGSRFEIMPYGDLLIKNVQWEDMGSYICVARNKYGESEEVAFLYPTELRNL
uniref:Immunoglobulin domain protein n=1 Tax=Caenorhabditis tropicalis TaxID=1561998 RepID=A0A1I7UEY2_9PELO